MPIKVAPQDLPNIIKSVDAMTTGTVQKLAHLARTHLVTQAKQQLRTSARDYVAAIQPTDFQVVNGEPIAVIRLDGAFPNMVENGAGPWDLRTTLLKPGAKGVKVSKSGHLYRAVVFRHMGPNASGQNGQAVGSQFIENDPQGTVHRGFKGALFSDPSLNAVAVAQMAKGVHGAAKKLGATTGQPGGKTQWGDRLPEGMAPKLRERHATDIFAGMVRETKKYGTATQSQFVTFRMISTNPKTKRWDTMSKSNKFGRGTPQGTAEVNWTHPGLVARKLFEKTNQYLLSLLASGALGNPGAPNGSTP